MSEAIQYRQLAIGGTVSMIVICGASSLFSDIRFSWFSMWPVWIVVALFLVLRIRYVRQKEENLVVALEGSAMLLLFTSFFAVSTYFFPEHSHSMYDTEFSVLDRMLIEAPPMIEFTRQWPLLDRLLVLVYNSLYIHLALIVIYAAGIRKNNTRAFLTLSRLFISAFIGLLLFALFPAYNATYFYNIDDIHQTLSIVTHLKHIREGSFIEFNYNEILGLIQFPSFHISTQFILLADIIENERRPTKAFFVLWTFLMGWSAITVGGHYVVDLYGGIGITLFSIVILKILGAHKKNFFS